MARYQLRRPSPVKVFPTRVRRQDSVASTMPVAEAEEEGPESPDSPFSSPSTVGGTSEGEDSESEDEEEPLSSVQSGAPATSAPAIGATSSTALSMPTSLTESNTSTTTLPSFTFGVPKSGNNALQPQITGSTLSTAVRPTITSTVIKEVRPTERPEPSSATTSVSLTSPPQNTAEPELSGESSAPQMLPQREQAPIMTKEAMTAAIVLGVLGSSASLLPSLHHC
jgi:hypothetical protein